MVFLKNKFSITSAGTILADAIDKYSLFSLHCCRGYAALTYLLNISWVPSCRVLIVVTSFRTGFLSFLLSKSKTVTLNIEKKNFCMMKRGRIRIVRKNFDKILKSIFDEIWENNLSPSQFRGKSFSVGGK